MSKEIKYSFENKKTVLLEEAKYFEFENLPILDLLEVDSSNNIDIYMKQARAVALPRLSFEQEYKVASTIHRGLKILKNNSNELEKPKIIEEVSEATNFLVSKHLFFVIPHAQKYSSLGVDLLDLISEGNSILFKAAEKFDPNKGIRFSTYSHYWLKDKLLRYVLNFGRIIRLPVNLQEKMYEMRNIEQQFHIRMSRRPTIKELAEETGLTVKKVEEFMIARKYPLSLDAPLRNSSKDLDKELGDIVEDKNSFKMFENADIKIDSTFILRKLEDLVKNRRISKRNADIFCFRYGAYDGAYYSLDEVGSHFGVTRERVRQIEKEVITKLKSQYPKLLI